MQMKIMYMKIVEMARGPGGPPDKQRDALRSTRAHDLPEARSVEKCSRGLDLRRSKSTRAAGQPRRGRGHGARACA